MHMGVLALGPSVTFSSSATVGGGLAMTACHHMVNPPLLFIVTPTKLKHNRYPASKAEFVYFVEVHKTACHVLVAFVCPAVLLQSLASKAKFVYFVEVHNNHFACSSTMIVHLLACYLNALDHLLCSSRDYRRSWMISAGFRQPLCLYCPVSYRHHEDFSTRA
ncbi:hypothetical protein Pelo_17301 [Pelomyxa schiedti]|nr:hypothetical protein Pelo_17301 [Pelomyxa schiedti]